MLTQGNMLNPVFNSNSILDLNMSIFKMVYDLYDTKSYIRNDILRDDYSLKCLFLEMNTKNPLEYLIKEEYADSFDDLYEEFRNDSNIEKYYRYYATASMINILQETTYTNTTIMCSNKKEAEFLEKIFPKTKIITGSQFNINGKYDAYYTGDIEDIGTFIQDPKGIQVKLLRFKYNLERKKGLELPKLSVAFPYMDTNKFSIMDPYTDVIVPNE